MNQINLWQNKSTFYGHFADTDWHAHAAPVLFMCLSGEFTIECQGSGKIRCSSALLDTGVAHKTAPQGEDMALFYLPPSSPLTAQLKRYYLCHQPFQFNIFQRQINPRRALRALQDFDLSPWLPRPLTSDVQPADQRIQHSLQLMHHSEQPLKREQLARAVHLSTSRFNHLFSEHMHTSFRQYRLWLQLGKTIANYQPGNSLTDIALAGGFSDMAHFSNRHKKMLGLAPSSILNAHTRINLKSGRL